jgi:hypothetical protein
VPDRHPDTDLLGELEPVAERLLNRHLAMAKEGCPMSTSPGASAATSTPNPGPRTSRG